MLYYSRAQFDVRPPPSPPSHTRTGNLLVLPDGRVGFIDFGIVGRISPVTWRAVEALLTATATNDFETMARALATIGVTSEQVDIQVSEWGRTRGGSSVLHALGKLESHWERGPWRPRWPPSA
jgi:hypothetical protein